MATTTLIVPVNVAALAVGAPDTSGQETQGVAENLAPMADFSRLPPNQQGPYTSTTVLENAVPFAGQVPLLQGIYLHWALPDGLTAGSASADGLAFPGAPNRWLVTRLVVSSPAGQAATTQVESWVVESDRLSATPTAPPGLFQPNVALAPDGEVLQPGGAAQNYAYLGQAFDLATWSEVGSTVPRLAPFTALGYGEPTFAAFFPNCSTVFGYYDALTDLGTGYDPAVSTITYQVAGWYSEPADDPLAQPGATPASYGWSAPAGSTPTATVCAGVMDAIPWNSATTYLNEARNPMTVAIGATPQEAISALMASVLQAADPGEYANAEQALNALQFGLFSRGSRVGDSLAALEEDVHAAGFAARAAGSLWTVTTAGSGQGEATLSAVLAEELDALNVAQLELNDAAFQLEAMQFQLFADWYKYQLIEHPPPPSSQGSTPIPPEADWGYAVQQYLQGEVDAIGALLARIVLLEADVHARAAALRLSLPGSATLTDRTGAPRYYQPADPVVILSGADVTPTERYGNDGAGSADGTLACRTGDQVVASVTLAAGIVTGSAQAQLAAAALPQLAAQPACAPAALLQSLLAEACFLSPGVQPAVVAAVAAQGGTANPALLDAAGTLQALQGADADFLAGTAPASVTFGGSAPAALYYDGWSGTPWLPILLQYSVQFAPVQYLDPSAGPAAYPPGFIASSFAFGAGTVELAYTGEAPAVWLAYEGSAILTPKATVDLSAQLSAFLAASGSTDPELEAVLTDLESLPLLAQGLTGATQAFLMRGATLQMPVADPLTPPTLLQFVAQVNAAVGSQNAAAPLPEVSFNPIRAGLLTIAELRLVDVFGRFKDYGSPPTVVSQGLAPPAALGAPAGMAFLPPRITQPARLLFRWRSGYGDVESNPAPASSPVRGWVIPNYLDHSLQIYAPAGTPLGELALAADGQRVLWTPAPGGAYPVDTPLATVFQGQNADLTHFAVGLGGDATRFAAFFATVTEALETSLAAQFAESTQQAVLAGEPLVLARATLALDLAGAPATDESWTSFQSVVLGGTPGDAGVGEVAFPVVLGAETRLDDTLVAYWIAPATAQDYQSFHPATAPDGAPPLTLTPQSASAGGTDVVLLLDPRGCVHATTGILPVQELSIPASQYAAALASLGVTFDSWPVLSGSNLPEMVAGAAPPMLMVQPKVPAGSWTWVTTDGKAWASTTLADAATAQATLSYSPQTISEGWLALTGLPEPS